MLGSRVQSRPSSSGMSSRTRTTMSGRGERGSAPGGAGGSPGRGGNVVAAVVGAAAAAKEHGRAEQRRRQVPARTCASSRDHVPQSSRAAPAADGRVAAPAPSSASRAAERRRPWAAASRPRGMPRGGDLTRQRRSAGLAARAKRQSLPADGRIDRTAQGPHRVRSPRSGDGRTAGRAPRSGQAGGAAAGQLGGRRRRPSTRMTAPRRTWATMHGGHDRRSPSRPRMPRP